MKNVIKRLIGNIECIGPKLSFSLRDFIPYVLAIFLVISIHSIRIEGDTLALITGLRKAMSCFHILNAEVPCGAGVLHFPIFQYLIGLLPALFSRKDEVVATTFIFVNLAGVFFAAYAFARGGALGAGKKGSHFAMILLLSSYFIWYPWSTFNEATAFTLFSMLAIAVLDKWSLAWISIISFLCVITKEMVIPPPLNLS